MSAFTKARAKAPARVLVVSPSAFSDEWREKPEEDVAIGLRLISDQTIQVARKQASKTAAKLYVDDDGRITDPVAFVESYNDGLIRYAIARGMCDPNDTLSPHPLFPVAEDQVQAAFTSDGARFVWDAIARFHAETSPLVATLDDLAIANLVQRIDGRDALARLPRAKQVTVRKLLGAVAELLEQDEDAVPVYSARSKE